MRMMVIFEKGYTLRHIGHLDLMRTMQRALRRSGLPLVYSKGFNPHIELSFASPLGVGVVGLREIMDVPLAEEVSEEEFMEKLCRSVPACIKVCKARRISNEFPALMALVAASRYTLRFPLKDAGELVMAKIPEFMALEEYVALRKTKSGENMCNIRPFVLESRAMIHEEIVEIHCVLGATQQGTLKPSLFFDCLRDFAGVKRTACLASREEILCRLPNGSLAPMEDYPDAS